MPFPHRLGFLVTLLVVVALVANTFDLALSLSVAVALALLASVKFAEVTDPFDLFDRSTLYFGLVAGLPLGFHFAHDLDHGLSGPDALLNSASSPAALMFAVVLAASFWVRSKLIKKSQRRGYFR